MKVFKNKEWLEALCVKAGHAINANNGKCFVIEDALCQTTTLCIELLKKIEPSPVPARRQLAELLHDLECNHDALGREESIYSRAIEMIEAIDSALAVTVESRAIISEQLAKLKGLPVDLDFHARLKLKTGDVVSVLGDNGVVGDFVVKAAPWQLGHGAWVIGLAGISGGYSLDRVVKLIRRAEASAPKPIPDGELGTDNPE